ncbi:MAG: VCBS repeat-containing protein [Bacteroidota bacterium]|nr:VCBS repeat-containing protein [Bacteroidota bacterium]
MDRNFLIYAFGIVFTIAITGCKNQSSVKENESSSEPNVSSGSPLFQLLPADSTHVDFINNITEGPNTNVLLYEYFYNGGGVAVGDLNGDGLQDIYFVGNMSGNKLYLNKGKMHFEDITTSDLAGRPGPWKTGVTMADVNGDGKLDIYVCYSGKLPAVKRRNQLFINEGNDSNGIPHFSEQAEQYGLADSSYSTQAYFFDYDRDGDLDLLLLNHNPNSLPVLDDSVTARILRHPDPETGIRLFRNDKNYFTDITEKAGLSSSALTYGLGAGIADLNGDGWQDIYISNDYSVPDYLYINNHNGTFSNVLQKSVGHTSEFSMGNDVADINNDGLPDIFTLDMLPEDNHRQKLLLAPDNYGKFNLALQSGYYYQYMRNMLQLNNGDGTFSEIGQLAGISNTDWSWSPLFADYDNDGWKDLFVTNGYLRDYTNMDFIKYMNDFVKSRQRLKKSDILQLIDSMPASNVINYLFKNNGNLTFTDVSRKWGINIPSNSNGAAYADLDNDGDLDLIINNINQPAFIYENETNKQSKANYVEINLKGTTGNTQGIGAKISIYSKGRQQYLEQMPSRGFQSSVSPVLHFGLGSDSEVDSLRVIWLGGRQQMLTHVKANQFITLDKKNATSPGKIVKAITPLFHEVKSPIDFSGQSNTINDFLRQSLLINPMSFFGPCLVQADVNGDGLEDVFAGGGNGEPGALYLQQKNGQFIKKSESAFDADKMSEDVDAVFFDANGDGFIDLYVCSGGYDDYTPDDALLQDRLYLNDGKGNFIKSTDALPVMHTSTSCARVGDANGDGYPDLFVGGRVIPGRYPEIPESYLLINDGKGHFKNDIATISPALQKIGMVTDAAWMDLNNDGKKDLIVVGEWMPVSIFINTNGHLENKTKDYFDKNYSGWWNKLLVKDLNNDGKPDLVVGNLGLNSQCRVSDKEPADLYYKDFDNNGTIDPILCFYIQHKSYPYVTRDEMINQLPMTHKRFPTFKSYADATLKDIFTEDELKDAKHLQANVLGTSLFEFGSDGKFHEKALPLQAQFSPVFTITALDYNKDGNLDLLLCGNINHGRLRFGKSDANYGVLLKGDGKGNFSYISQRQSGFNIKGDVRSVININNDLLFGINQSAVRAYKLK